MVYWLAEQWGTNKGWKGLDSFGRYEFKNCMLILNSSSDFLDQSCCARCLIFSLIPFIWDILYTCSAMLIYSLGMFIWVM